MNAAVRACQSAPPMTISCPPSATQRSSSRRCASDSAPLSAAQTMVLRPDIGSGRSGTSAAPITIGSGASATPAPLSCGRSAPEPSPTIATWLPTCSKMLTGDRDAVRPVGLLVADLDRSLEAAGLHVERDRLAGAGRHLDEAPHGPGIRISGQPSFGRVAVVDQGHRHCQPAADLETAAEHRPRLEVDRARGARRSDGQEHQADERDGAHGREDGAPASCSSPSDVHGMAPGCRVGLWRSDRRSIDAAGCRQPSRPSRRC